MKIDKDLFMNAKRGKQMEFIWDKLEEIHLCAKTERKKRYALTVVSGFVGGCFAMLMLQFKMLWKSIIGG